MKHRLMPHAFAIVALGLTAQASAAGEETWEFVRSFSGHTDAVRSVDAWVNGSHILTGSQDGTARLWSVLTGDTVETREDLGPVRYVAFTESGQYVTGQGTSWGPDTAILWEPGEEDEIQSYTIPDLVATGSAASAWALSPDGSHVFAATANVITPNFSRDILWSAESGLEWSHDGVPDAVGRSAAFSPDGTTVLLGRSNAVAELLDIEEGDSIRTFHGHMSSVISVAFSPDGTTIATGSWDGTVRLWDVETGDVLHTFWEDEEEQKVIEIRPSAVAFSFTGSRLLAGDTGGRVTIWDAATGEELHVIEAHQETIRDIATLPRSFFATASDDGSAVLWWAGRIPPAAREVGDLTNSGTVGFGDFDFLLSNWGAEIDEVPVWFPDFFALLENWGTSVAQ